jgi:alkyl sulfatase BDS1-like metallo-beta-lactamase superfamily hydrolase
MQRLYFDVVKRAANAEAANGSKLVYQWRFTDADPWHLVLDNGSTRAEPGEAPNPTVTLETSWADFVSTSKPEANPLKMVLTRRIRPRGSIREIARMRKVFG